MYYAAFIASINYLVYLVKVNTFAMLDFSFGEFGKII